MGWAIIPVLLNGLPVIAVLKLERDQRIAQSV